MDAMRLFLPTYLVLFLGVAFLWRSYVVWKQTGINPYVLGNGDSAHDFIGRLFRLTIGVQVIVVLLYTFWSEGYTYLVSINWLQSSILTAVGIVLLLVSLVWVVIAQAQMGKSWRVGIDTTHKTQLVQHGIFRFSRNPIFLGMRAMSLGLFLILPNALTLTTFVLSETLIQIQVRLEENHLAGLHGEQYATYRKHTRRWL